LEVRWIELWPLNLEGGGPDSDSKENRYEGKDIDKTKEILCAHGIGVACVTMPGAFFNSMASDPEDYLSAMYRAIDVAADLNCRLINSYCYHFALGRMPILPAGKSLNLAEDYAMEKGVILVLENEAHDATATVDGMCRILEAVDSPAMKTNLDPCNYYHATEEAFPYAYHRLKKHLGYVHLKNGCLYDPLIHPEHRRRSAITGRDCDHHIITLLWLEGPNIEGFRLSSRRIIFKGFCTLEPMCPPKNWKLTNAPK
jgi:sugar phosphate isomerase/epimerase